MKIHNVVTYILGVLFTVSMAIGNRYVDTIEHRLERLELKIDKIFEIIGKK